MGSAVATIAGRQSQVPAGTKLGRYCVVRRLASGGMCEVYLARAEGESGFAKPVALKLVLPHLVEEANFTTLLEREAKLAAYLNHPNIVQTFELGREGDELYIAMEYVHGQTLRDVLAQIDGPLPLDVALSVMVATCTALHTAHCATGEGGNVLGVVHRDVSPANVMLRHDGVVKVVDFGIAKAMTETTMTKTGTLKGKSGYMSPEQCRGDELTPASDIFNLGILLYEVTTGRRAFGGANIFETMNRIVDGRYRAPRRHVPDYPPALAAIVERALSDDPADRPVSALALRHELEAFSGGAGLALSDWAVQQWLENRFGTVAPVDLRLDPSVVVTVAPKRTAAASRAFNWAGAAVIGALAGSAAFLGLGATSPDEAPAAAEAMPPPAVAEPSAARPVVAAVPSEPSSDTAPADPIVTAAAEPEPDAKPAESVATAVAEPKNVPPAPVETPPATKRPRKGKTKRSKTGRSKSRSKPAAKSDEPLFPWKSN